MAGVWKRDGTIAVTKGSKKVVGTGTTFADPKNAAAKGHLLVMVAGTAVDLYEVDYAESNTVFYLVEAYRGDTGTGKAYAIDTSRTDSIPEFARRLNATLGAYQQQSDAFQALLTSDAATIEVTAPDGTKHTMIPWKRVTSEGEGQAARAKAEADKAAVSAAAAASAALAARLPPPDVSIPLTLDGQLLHGKGTPVLVGTTPIAQLVGYERLGPQTMLDKSGRLVTVPAGEMAIEQQGLAIFDQSVNLAAPSINWVSAGATLNWMHGAKNAAGWITLTGSSDPAGSSGSYKDFIAPTAGVYTFSFDILKTAGLNCRVRVFDGGSPNRDITITETTVSGTGSEAVYDAGDYWRVELTVTLVNAARPFRIHPFGTEVGATGTMTYRRVQLEAKPFATPYIENATSAQTVRPATTRCDIPWPGNMQPLSNNQVITLAYEFDLAGIPPSGALQSIVASGGGGFGTFAHQVVASAAFQALRAASGSTHSFPIGPRRKYKVCYRINKNVCDMFLDGVKVGQSVTATPTNPGLPDVLRLGYLLTPDRCLNGHLHAINIWNTPLTDSQCQAASS